MCWPVLLRLQEHHAQSLPSPVYPRFTSTLPGGDKSPARHTSERAHGTLASNSTAPMLAEEGAFPGQMAEAQALSPKPQP